MNFNARAWVTGVLVAVIAAVGVVVVNAQQKTQRKDPLPAFLFEVEIGGQKAFFRSVSGLKMETDVIEFQEGGETGFTRKLAGATHFANIRLSRAFTGDRALFDWFVQTKKPNPVRVNGRITMLDRQLNQIASWKFVNGFPVKWEGPDLDATKSEVSIETIEIAHEGLTMSPDGDDNQ